MEYVQNTRKYKNQTQTERSFINQQREQETGRRPNALKMMSLEQYAFLHFISVHGESCGSVDEDWSSKRKMKMVGLSGDMKNLTIKQAVKQKVNVMRTFTAGVLQFVRQTS